ncbi:MAG: PA2169 family four-helix-bundle protein [Niabella sp.]
METLNSKKQVEILNDLLQINNDRIVGYEHARNELSDNKDDDLKELFKRMINKSVDNNESLERLIDLYNGEPAAGTSGMGKVYRAWMDVKALFSGGNRKAILDSCETGDAAALRAYADALYEEDLGKDVRELIIMQKEALYNDFIQIRALKEAAS